MSFSKINFSANYQSNVPIGSNSLLKKMTEFHNDRNRNIQSISAPSNSNLLNLMTDFTKKRIEKAKQLNNSKEIIVKENIYKNGAIGKIYNFAKQITSFGLSKKDIKIAEEKLNNDKITVDEYNKLVKDYNYSQENFVQSAGNLLSAGAAITTAGIGERFMRWQIAKKEIGQETIIENLEKIDIEKDFKKIKIKIKGENIEKFLKNKNKRAGLFIVISGLVGGLFKQGLLKLDRIGSKRYKVENKTELSKADAKKAKKELKKQKRSENTKNFYTGAIMGILSPIAVLFSPVIGVLGTVLGSNVLNFLTTKTIDKKEKTFDNFTNKLLKQNQIVNLATSAAIGAMALRKGNAAMVFNKNLKEVTKSLKDVNLQEIKEDTITPFEKLKSLMLNSPAIKDINQSNLPVDKAIQKLTEENIFAVKFMQIEKSGKIGRALIENCPPTRNLMQAQTYINENFGANQYEITKLLGVGTIAETYLAKEVNSGKEVCIKMLKKGINAEKIQKDKEAFINLVTKGKKLNELSQEEKFYVQNIENLAEGIAKEVDLANEMEAAKKLVKNTRCADVVKPILVKNNIYIMEKAKGISLDAFRKYIDLKSEYECTKISIWKKLYEDKPIPKVINFTEEELQKVKDEWYYRELKSIEAKIQKIKETSPFFNDFEITNNDLQKLIKEYIKVQTEQFTKLEKGEKVIHADIHPGNIFINVDALKGKTKEKIFTLIDTGNIVNLSKEQSVRCRYLTSYIAKGNVSELTKIIMEDAILPSNVTKEEASKFLQEKLKERFFDTKTALPTVTIDTLFSIATNILKEKNVIVKDTQLNLNKAKKASFNSFKDLITNMFQQKYNREESLIDNTVQAAMIGLKVSKDITAIGSSYVKAQKLQEYKNLLKMSFEELKNITLSKGNLETNSKDYLTYKIKQNEIIPGFNPQLIQETFEC